MNFMEENRKALPFQWDLSTKAKKKKLANIKRK